MRWQSRSVFKADAVIGRHHFVGEDHSVWVTLDPRTLRHVVDVASLNSEGFTWSLFTIFSATVEE